mmetsp:Transcript_11948/g.42245  ORF Transcript_11948/g.42245 Transcript_11948/m.42245 type:complete len:526 (+) Transcript_11948:144-1721(+)
MVSAVQAVRALGRLLAGGRLRRTRRYDEQRALDESVPSRDDAKLGGRGGGAAASATAHNSARRWTLPRRTLLVYRRRPSARGNVRIGVKDSNSTETRVTEVHALGGADGAERGESRENRGAPPTRPQLEEAWSVSSLAAATGADAEGGGPRRDTRDADARQRYDEARRRDAGKQQASLGGGATAASDGRPPAHVPVARRRGTGKYVEVRMRRRGPHLEARGGLGGDGAVAARGGTASGCRASASADTLAASDAVVVHGRLHGRGDPWRNPADSSNRVIVGRAGSRDERSRGLSRDVAIDDDDHFERRSTARRAGRRATAAADEAERRPTKVLSSNACVADGRKKLCCHKCDGAHEESACPWFKKAREKHPDATWAVGKAKHLGHDSHPIVTRTARVVAQPPDGSCLFHSLSYGLREGSTPAALRREIATFIRNNPDLRISDTPLRDWIKWDALVSVATYASRMASGAWGGGIEMAAASELKNCCIEVYEPCAAGFRRISHFRKVGALKVVRVCYKGGVHYDALVL